MTIEGNIGPAATVRFTLKSGFVLPYSVSHF